TRCLSDWSSDVCSSDLFARDIRNATAKYRIEWFSYHEAARSVALANSVKWAAVLDGNTLRITVGSWATPLQDVTLAVQNLAGREIGRASCRERVREWGG